MSKRAKNLYMSKDKPKTSVFYPAGIFVQDQTGKKFEVYQRGKTEFFVDIPCSTNETGLIIKGYFVCCIKEGNIFDLGLKKIWEKKLQNKIKKMNLEKEAQKLIERHKEFMVK